MSDNVVSPINCASGSESRTDFLWLFMRKFPPHIVFLIVGGINAIVLSLLTPPFQVHDEFQHFFRTYQLTDSRLQGRIEDGRIGADVPTTLTDFVSRTWGTLEVWKTPPLGVHPLAALWSENRVRIQEDDKHFTEFLTVSYSPLLYIPQTLGVAVGRLIGASPVMLLTCGRLANAIAAIAAIAWALKIMPVGREMALAIALFPMAQFEYGSVAPDATIIAAGYLLTAIVLRASSRAVWPASDVLASVIAAGVLCAKVVYAPMLAIGMSAAFQLRNSNDWRKFFLRSALPQLIIAAIALGVTVLWLTTASATLAVTKTASTVPASVRAAAILAAPTQFVAMLVSDIIFHGPHYAFDAIGIFGAWTVALPGYAYGLAFVTLIQSILLSQESSVRLNTVAIAYACCLIISTVALIQTVMYIFATNNAQFMGIAGVQGRYFLPLGAVIAATASSIRFIPRIKETAALVYALLVAVLIVNTLSMNATIVTEFQLF